MIRQNNTQLRQFSLTHFVLACHSDSVEQVGSHDLPKPLPPSPSSSLLSHRIGLRLRLGHCLLEIFSLRLQLCPVPLPSSHLVYITCIIFWLFVFSGNVGRGGRCDRDCRREAAKTPKRHVAHCWRGRRSRGHGTLPRCLALCFHFISFRFDFPFLYENC